MRGLKIQTRAFVRFYEMSSKAKVEDISVFHRLLVGGRI